MSTETGSNESQPLLEAQTTPVTPLPRAQLASLCIAKLADPISYTQIFPYINEFLAVLHVTDDPAKIGFYSGLIESASSFAQVLTIFHWTKLSDRVGRRPIILAGALGLAIVSLLFGLCRTFAQALLVRTLSGLLSGNCVVYQVVLGEITDSTNQAAAYPLFGCIYLLGSTIGPLLGGFFSNLATKYPKYFGYPFFESYPYFLPGFVCASIAMLGFAVTYCFLEETLSSHGDDDTARESAHPSTMSIPKLLSIPSVWSLTWSSFVMSFLGTAHTVVFTLFCYTPVENGGLAFSVAEIGYAVALSSGIFAVFQILLMPTLLRKFDIARLYRFAMGVWPLSFATIPILNGMARYSLALSGTRNKIVLWIGIAVVQILSRIASICYPTNLILVRSNSPSPSDLGAANGINQLVMAVSRCVSPGFVSSLFALSVQRNLLGGHLWAIVMTVISGLGYCVSRSVKNPR